LKGIENALGPMLDCFGERIVSQGLAKLEELGRSAVVHLLRAMVNLMAMQTPQVYMEAMLGLHRHSGSLVTDAF